MPEIVKIHPALVSGRAVIPSSKSLCHRAILSAALSEGESVVRHVSMSADIEATLNVARKLGAKVTAEKEDDSLTITIRGCRPESNTENAPVELDCGESGSTLRFIVPIFSVLGICASYTGHGKLPERPMDVYYDLFDSQQVAYETTEGKLPLTVTGTLHGGEISVDGGISSQFITGLMMALPLAKEDSVLHITGKVESRPYIDLTLQVIRAFGITIEEKNERTYVIPGDQKYTAREYTVEADASQAAFFITAAALGAKDKILIEGCHKDTAQGDIAFVMALEAFGGRTEETEEGLYVYPLSQGAQEEEREFSALQCPDIVPIMAVLGSYLPGSLHIVGAGRLRIKESDRLEAITKGLEAMGADITEEAEGLMIRAGYRKTEEIRCVNSFNDHRIAMSLAISALRSDKGVMVEDAGCVNKSWPTFWEDLERLAPGSVEIIR